jgi:acetylornithine deacetylase
MTIPTRVLNEIDNRRDDMMALLTELITIPSVGGADAENDAVHHMARLYANAGLDVDHWEIDLPTTMANADFPGVEVDRTEAWAVVGRLPGAVPDPGGSPGESRSLMFNGHVDVVPPGDTAAWSTTPYDPRVSAGQLFGRGSCDMKAGVIAALWAADAIRSAGVRLKRDLILTSVLGEEDGGLGTYSVLQRGWRADACVISEPTNLDLVPGNAGALTFRLIVTGHATHASRRTEGVSAIEKFIPLYAALQHLEAERNAGVTSTHAQFALAYPISIGTISSGDWASSVPDLLVANGRFGVALDEPLDDARRVLETAIARACDADPWLRAHPVRVEWWGGQFASGKLPASSDLGERVLKAHGLVSNTQPSSWIAPYGSDLRLMTGIGGVPTVQYGPGDVALAHGPDESVPIADVITTARTLALVALDVCGFVS